MTVCGDYDKDSTWVLPGSSVMILIVCHGMAVHGIANSKAFSFSDTLSTISFEII